ncbi:hypothetical protein CH063_06018 [Colletotrichum higginsianum]|nr:hypothetical protein CH063_06018 [Colletotrichum higginsianum]
MPKKGKSYDEIPLSRGVEVAGFRGLSSKSVLGDVEYGLEVVINNLDGTTTPLDRVPSLKIEVEDVNFVAPDSLNELPTIGEAQCRAVKARPLTISN